MTTQGMTTQGMTTQGMAAQGMAARNVAPGSVLAEFYRMRGRRLRQIDGVWWSQVDANSRYWTTLPDQLIPEAQPEAMAQLLRDERALLLRYPRRQGVLESGVYVMRDAAYDLPMAQKRMRNFIRRGLDTFTIRPVEQAQLLNEGWELNQETMGRHGRMTPDFGDRRQWARVVESIYRLPEARCYGAFEDNRLACYVFGVVENGWLHLLTKMSRVADLERFANQALDFQVTADALRSGDAHTVCLGPVALQASPGLHDYKLRMGFAVEPYSVGIQFHPLLQPVLTSTPGRLLLRRLHAWPRVAAVEHLLQGVTTREENEPTLTTSAARSGQ
jgi:hypothetical protein